MTNKLAGCALLFCCTAFSQNSDPGRGEIRGFIGTTVDTSSILSEEKLGGGVEGAFHLNRHVAVTANYALNRVGTGGFCFAFPCGPFPDEKIHEFMGGVRLSTATRVAPYVLATIGGIRTENFHAAASGKSTEFALGVGVGLDFRITRNTGIALEVRGIDAVSSQVWFVRPTIGFFFRF